MAMMLGAVSNNNVWTKRGLLNRGTIGVDQSIEAEVVMIDGFVLALADRCTRQKNEHLEAMSPYIPFVPY
jgi:hypothetical protein